MATTKGNLDIQSDKVLTEPQVQTRALLRDAAAVQTLYLDWDEPVGADRTVNLEDPGANDTIAYLNKAQTFQNKQISTPPAGANDIANKTYVDTAVAAASPPDATAGSGGGVKGIATFDSDKGLDVAAGVAEIKVDGLTISFDGSGRLQGATTLPDATSGSGGGVVGKVTADSDKGLEILAGAVMSVKVDGATIQFNLSGELEVIGGGGGGGATGFVSGTPNFTEDIGGVTAPGNGTISGGDISTLDFDAASTEGTRFAWTVPEDYASGDIEVSVVYRMATSSGLNQMRISTQAKIVDVDAGVIDTATYPETQATIPTLITTDIVRQLLLNITSGDFNRGDVIQMLVKRFGGDGADTHPADWQVIQFAFKYIAILDGRVVTRAIKFFENPPSGTPTTPDTISSGDISVEEFPTGIDSGLRFEFLVPDNWDAISSAEISLTYTMSLGAASPIRLETRGKIARSTAGSIDTISAANYDFTATNDTFPHKTVSIRSIPPGSFDKGDVISIILNRLGTSGADTHIGDFQLICATITFATLPVTGTSLVQIKEDYLNQGTFGNPSGAGVNGDTAYPSLTWPSDFETLDSLSSTVASGSLDIAYSGRLAGAQTQVTQIRVPLKGTGASPNYTLKVYAEGTGQVYTSGLQPAPVSLTETVLGAIDLSAQPTGLKRFHVVVEAAIDAGEAVLVGRPFVRME